MNSQHFESVGRAKKTADTRVKCSGDMCDGLTLKREEECPRSHLHSEERKQTSLVYIREDSWGVLEGKVFKWRVQLDKIIERELVPRESH